MGAGWRRLGGLGCGSFLCGGARGFWRWGGGGEWLVEGDVGQGCLMCSDVEVEVGWEVDEVKKKRCSSVSTVVWRISLQTFDN